MSETSNVVQVTTGESITGLAAALAGMLFGPTVADMTVGRFSPFGTSANTLILGAGGAYLFRNGNVHVRRAFQGAALVGAAELLRQYVPVPGASGGSRADSGWVTI